MDRRNFLTCVAGGAAGLLVGSSFLPSKEECVPSYLLKPFVGWGNIAHVSIDGTMVQYAVIKIDTDQKYYSFSTTFENGVVNENSAGGIGGKDLGLLTKFEKDSQSDYFDYKNRYLIINNNGEYGFLATERPCWNFRKYSA